MLSTLVKRMQRFVISKARCSIAASRRMQLSTQHSSLIDASHPDVSDILRDTMLVHEDFLSELEEASLMEEVEPLIKKLRSLQF